MKILGLIPARGGSKGIPRKNVLDLAGKPLIGWSIEVASASKYLDAVVVSTDDLEIAKVALDFGAEVPFLRPPEFSSDTASGVSVILHALSELRGYDMVVLLQPTSPLRSVHDIDGCIEAIRNSNASTVVSVCEASTHPAWTYEIDNAGRLKSFYEVERACRRQDLPKAYALNGAVYAATVRRLCETSRLVDQDTISYIMPPERSVDIDTMIDFRMAELLLRDRN